jgi:hypothetical protein
MECWIGHTDEPGQRVVRVAGYLASAQVPDLLVVCRGGCATHLTIDLSDLLNADVTGIETLRRLAREGASLVEVPEYIRLKLSSAC